MTKIKRPASETLGDLLDELAERHPEKQAIIFGGHRITYKELKDQADILGRSLINLGVKPGDRVALLAPNRPEWLIAAFAIAKLGAITAAISTFSTPSELSWTLKNCGAVALITVPLFKGNEFLKTIINLSQKDSKEDAHNLNIDSLPQLKFVISLDNPTENYAIGWDDYFSQLTTRKAAMLPIGTWGFGDTIAGFSEISDEFGWSKLPILGNYGGNPNYQLSIGSTMSINAASKFPDEAAKVINWMISDKKRVVELTKNLGGTISGEHGIGLVQRDYMDIVLSDKNIELQKGIKKLFDPNQILNPGKIF